MCPGFLGVGLLAFGFMRRFRSCSGAVRIRSGEHAERGVASLAVVEDLEVLEDRFGEFQPRPPFAAVE